MASSVDSILLGRAVCRSFPSLTPISRPRCLSTFISSSVARRGLTSRTLVRPCLSISTAVSPVDIIKRADRKLLDVLLLEIKYADKVEVKPIQALVDMFHRADRNILSLNLPERVYDEPTQEVALPEDSPFEIVDNPGDQPFKVLLKREFKGQNIEVRVYTKEDDELLSLVVTVSTGPGTALEFCCWMDSQRLEIEGMALKRHVEADSEEPFGWPLFDSLDWNWRTTLRSYLGVRGINPSLHHFVLHSLTDKNDMRVTGESLPRKHVSLPRKGYPLWLSIKS